MFKRILNLSWVFFVSIASSNPRPPPPIRPEPLAVPISVLFSPDVSLPQTTWDPLIVTGKKLQELKQGTLRNPLGAIVDGKLYLVDGCHTTICNVISSLDHPDGLNRTINISLVDMSPEEIKERWPWITKPGPTNNSLVPDIGFETYGERAWKGHPDYDPAIADDSRGCRTPNVPRPKFSNPVRSNDYRNKNLPFNHHRQPPRGPGAVFESNFLNAGKGRGSRVVPNPPGIKLSTKPVLAPSAKANVAAEAAGNAMVAYEAFSNSNEAAQNGDWSASLFWQGVGTGGTGAAVGQAQIGLGLSSSAALTGASTLLMYTGVGLVAAGAGYGIGTGIDQAGYNPITPLAVHAAENPEDYNKLINIQHTGFGFR